MTTTPTTPSSSSTPAAPAKAPPDSALSIALGWLAVIVVAVWVVLSDRSSRDLRW